jgi:hypothetical protein
MSTLACSRKQVSRSLERKMRSVERHQKGSLRLTEVFAGRASSASVTLTLSITVEGSLTKPE